MSIGLASSYGKIWIHSSTSNGLRMATATTTISNYGGRGLPVMTIWAENIVYINVANRLSVDRLRRPSHDPEMGTSVFSHPLIRGPDQAWL